MCGIAGILSNQFALSADHLKKMTDTIAHRGPDGSGHWINPNKTIGLGHRRLSILDLSSAGAQPMHYAGKYSITYNGEIYNYVELKDVLQKKGYSFQSQTDTEVILAAYDCYKEECLKYFDGMFAFAIWDESEQSLFCARDRFGEKPFYYHFDNHQNFYFASEMKALWAVNCPRSINQKLLFYYLAHNVILNPFDAKDTFYNNIYSLKPAHFMVLKKGAVTTKRYWEINTDTKKTLTDDQVYEQFKSLLQESIRRRLRSDVAVGSSLSGGLDSSSIVTLINQITHGNSQHCFSARFNKFSKDEGHYIDLLTNKMKIQRHDIWINDESSIAQIDKVLYHQEEPFQSGSIIAQWLVYQKSRQEGVLVMLDGQGADEYLGGYLKDFQVYLREKFLQNPFGYKSYYEKFASHHQISHKINSDFLMQSYVPGLKKGLSNLLKNFRSPEHKKFLHHDFYNNHLNDETPFENTNDLKDTFKYELSSYGLNKLLRFADRNAMGNSIEVRLPFLSHELIEFVFSLPSDLFYKNGWSKSLLRHSMQGTMIPEITWRKDKIGFEAPQNMWMKSKLIADQVIEAKQFLLKEKIINQHYTDDWNALMTYKFIHNSHEPNQ